MLKNKLRESKDTFDWNNPCRKLVKNFNRNGISFLHVYKFQGQIFLYFNGCLTAIYFLFRVFGVTEHKFK